MRLIRPVLAVFCLVLGVFVGVLNRGAVAIDLGPVVLHTTLGVALIGALLAGVLAGGLATLLSRSPPPRHSDTPRPPDAPGQEI